MKNVILLTLLFIIPISAQSQTGNEEFLIGFLPGSYEALGRLPESDSLYSGSVLFQNADSDLVVIRRISGMEIRGTARIEKTAGGDATVLRVRFKKDGQIFEITYLIQSDLDNYARLNGYVYRKDGSTQRPGIEVLFHSKKKP